MPRQLAVLPNIVFSDDMHKHPPEVILLIPREDDACSFAAHSQAGLVAQEEPHLRHHILLHIQDVKAHKGVLLAVRSAAVGNELRRDVCVRELDALSILCESVHDHHRGAATA